MFNSGAYSPPRYCGLKWLENRFDWLVGPPTSLSPFVCARALTSVYACTLVCVQMQHGRLVEIRGQLGEVCFAFHHEGSGSGTQVVRISGKSL